LQTIRSSCFPATTDPKVPPQKTVLKSSIPMPTSYYSVGETDGMRGRKRSFFEGGVPVPFLIRWLGHLPAGVKNDITAFPAVDLLPSFVFRRRITRAFPAWHGRRRRRGCGR
jgi:hypothetical protein